MGEKNMLNKIPKATFSTDQFSLSMNHQEKSNHHRKSSYCLFKMKNLWKLIPKYPSVLIMTCD